MKKISFVLAMVLILAACSKPEKKDLSWVWMVSPTDTVSFKKYHAFEVGFIVTDVNTSKNEVRGYFKEHQQWFYSGEGERPSWDSIYYNAEASTRELPVTVNVNSNVFKNNGKEKVFTLGQTITIKESFFKNGGDTICWDGRAGHWDPKYK